MRTIQRLVMSGGLGVLGAVAAVGAALAQAAGAPAPAAAPTVPPLDSGHTAWMLTSTALVLLMTIPGVALFYAGMVRKKNVLATMMQSFAITCLVAVLWMVAGYSLAFTGEGAFIGTFERFFMRGLTMDGQSPLGPKIPETVYMMFQMTFAIITCALIAGSVADRMKFSALLLFVAIWLFVVYAPVAHWVWAGGFMSKGEVFGINFGGVLDLSLIHI